MRALRSIDARQPLLASGLAPRTVVLYVRSLQRFERWCDERSTTMGAISPESLTTYVESLPRTAASRRQVRSALGHYWRLVGRRNPPLYAIRVPRKPRMVCRAMEEDDARILAKAARARGDRAGLATMVALYMALRREEIATIAWHDIKLGDWLVVIGKGNKEARLPLHPILVEEFAHWPRSGPYVFAGRFGGHVTPTTIWQWVRTVSEDAGLGRVPTHICRHTALAKANDVTGNLRAVQDFARHDDIRSTAGYTRTTADQLRSVVASLDYGG